CAPWPAEEMLKRVYDVIDNMNQKEIQKILRVRMETIQEELAYYPAAQRLHHAERSGLLHHMISMLKTADAILSCYPWLNGDLLRAGVILHDLSKIEEMDSDALGNVKDYTKDGLLIGHLVRGVANLAKAAQEAGVTGEIPLLLEHMILSHHGVAEYGSPRMPMFPEAEALHWIDVFDAKMNEMQGILKRTLPGTFSERIWSLDRRIYHPVYEQLAHEQEDVTGTVDVNKPD
ncbi:MAG: CMP-binding protein, partial [Clostridiales bacterium]|nr:CMP-binding protein [Clostridiales bacterium]